MVFPSSDSKFHQPLFQSPAMSELFSDEAYLGRLIQVEVALAKVQERLSVIPPGTSNEIAVAADNLTFDWHALRESIDLTGLPVIDIVRQLREATGPSAGSYVHWGATTQDVMDTALVLQMRDALLSIEDGLRSLIGNYVALAREHRNTVMTGRTHSQHALPITFGLKIANWAAPLLRQLARLDEIRSRGLVVQFGGAAGTLASLHENGLLVQAELARELGLANAPLPWHTQRDSLVEIANWLALLTGTLAKTAQDMILMAQSEVGEIAESSDKERGGSSTMPQKSNPVINEVIIAAARTNAGLLSALHNGLIQEHERGTHGWQMEWINLPQMFRLTAASLEKARFLSRNVVVNRDRMQENIVQSWGTMMAEALTFALAQEIPREQAKRLVKDAARVAVANRRHLVDIVRERSNLSLDWELLRDESSYLGVTEELIDRFIKSASMTVRPPTNQVENDEPSAPRRTDTTLDN